ncbi:uncharacterized protein LOC123553999 isoform X2 [Mercenaria mercenaria]|nr:uncharacterized protein LOC123553999 isoform X2 [Mercenaria mercenaria]
MDKFTHFIQLLIVFGGLVLIDAQYPYPQPGYGRRRIIRPRLDMYPRYPVDPYSYPRRSVLGRTIIRDPFNDGVGGVGRPAIVDTRSRVDDQTLNVVNNNNNENIQQDSNNVVVNQSSGRSTCTDNCYTNLCPQYYTCVDDSSCTGGMCQPAVLMGQGGLMGRGGIMGQGGFMGQGGIMGQGGLIGQGHLH